MTWDADGYVSRKDFLRMFRAYYAVQKEITRDLMAVQEEELTASGALDAILSSQPLSAAFTDMIPPGDRTIPEQKRQDRVENEQDESSNVVLDSQEDVGDRNRIIGDMARITNRRTLHTEFSRTEQDQTSSREERSLANRGTHGDEHDRASTELSPLIVSSGPMLVNQEQGEGSSSSARPQHLASPQISENHLGNRNEEASRDAHPNPDTLQRETLNINTDTMHVLNGNDLMHSPTNEQSGNEAVLERWRRRHFYVDDEEGFKPPKDLSQEVTDREWDESGTTQRESGSGAQSAHPRSRSSSKVRFEDDPELDTRSNASTSSRPVGERWGGYEIPEAEKRLWEGNSLPGHAAGAE